MAACIAINRQTHSDPLEPAPRGRPPKALTVRDRMDRKLRTVAGRAVYACRKKIVEPVFGQINHARGFRHLLRRGLRNVGEDWALICIAHTVFKLFAAKVGT